MSTRSTLPSAILALLAEGPLHPYGIQHLIRERRDHEVINVEQRAALYAAIKRLAREGLIRPHSVDRVENRPERTAYELTEAGREHVDAWLRGGLATPPREFPEFPAVLAFLDRLTPAEASRALRERLDALDAEGRRLGRGLEVAASVGVPRLFTIEVEYLQAACRAERAWVAALVADLDSGALAWTPESVRAARSRLPRSPKED